ncbi:MAG: F0F1 ATP synthase subunit B [Phycisphaerae bacterium]
MHYLVPVFAVPASVSPVLGSAEGGTGNPFAGDIGVALWTLIIFALVVVILGKFAWGPILAALKGREDFIHDSLDRAKREREEAQSLLADYKRQVAAAKEEATAIVEEGRRDAEALRQKIEGDARAESQAMLERAKRELALATDSAIKELYDVSGKLATDIASRIIRKELNQAEHERLISESIEELGKAIERN